MAAHISRHCSRRASSLNSYFRYAWFLAQGWTTLPKSASGQIGELEPSYPLGELSSYLFFAITGSTFTLRFALVPAPCAPGGERRDAARHCAPVHLMPSLSDTTCDEIRRAE
jgi:hypothetical protein